MLRKTLKMMYDAVVPSSRRRTTWTFVGQSEDNVLNRSRRRIGTEAVRDVLRFSAPANFALDTHLQFTANFVFQCDYADEEIRNRVKRWYKEWSATADYTGRTSLNGLIRKIETCRIV
jgi:capsid protein